MSTKAARLKKAASVKIQHHIGGLRTNIPAQMCVAGPPVATQLGQLGINIQQFVKDFNLRTSIYREGVPLPTRTTINPDRSYNLVIHHPTATYFLKQAAGVKRGSMQGGKETTGYITRKHLYEIALVKSQDPPLQMVDLQDVCRLLIDSAHSLGIRVVDEIDPEWYQEFLEERKEIVRKEAFAYRKYRDLLDEKTPELFSGKYKIITEFGRSLLLKAGKSLTRINYIKNWLPEFVKPICLTHLGTNQFIRAAYLPKTWSHRMSAIDGKTGKLKKSEEQVTYDVAGPLCFQGDFLGHDVVLPKLEKGDIIVVHDTGGYTMSMYSKYNSITPSAVYGYERMPNSGGENNGFIDDKLAAQCGPGSKFRIRCFKERETPEETLAFWGNAYPRIVN